MYLTTPPICIQEKDESISKLSIFYSTMGSLILNKWNFDRSSTPEIMIFLGCISLDV